MRELTGQAQVRSRDPSPTAGRPAAPRRARAPCRVMRRQRDCVSAPPRALFCAVNKFQELRPRLGAGGLPIWKDMRGTGGAAEGMGKQPVWGWREGAGHGPLLLSDHLQKYILFCAYRRPESL
ncbi:hypothetical protein NDU88_001050 [Pleurodeles waltl]|uniref:Uncharacterized protein n=1 Tax=Pleurodeles waltl TaxID=8319 RepID=A0AAV7KNJ8_PLEWA|nr:hypothetical protein NDU88_001050 [Pleurodeles waltl]